MTSRSFWIAVLLGLTAAVLVSGSVSAKSSTDARALATASDVTYSNRCVGERGKHRIIKKFVGGICIPRIRYNVTSPAGLAAAAYAAYGYCVRTHQKLAYSYTGVFINTGVAAAWCDEKRWFWIHVT